LRAGVRLHNVEVLEAGHGFLDDAYRCHKTKVDELGRARFLV
jgi:hypothetical protein